MTASSNVKKALFIVGPTASGKTDLAFKISKKIPSVIIGADSVQVYRRTDVISGKDLPASRQISKVDSSFDHYIIDKTPLYLIDVVEPTNDFSVYDYVNKVKLTLESIDKNKLPIIVGGTRFYINAFTQKIDTLSIPPDLKLRKKLTKYSIEKLQETLSKLDPQKFKNMNNSDVNNPRRLVRAIEVAKNKFGKNIEPLFEESEVLMIGLTASYEFLKMKIDTRLEKRLKQGAIAEARNLFNDYNKLSDQIKNTHGFKQLFEYFQGKIDLDTAIEKWRLSEYHLAKEQLAWIRKNPNIHLFNVEESDPEKSSARLIDQNF